MDLSLVLASCLISLVGLPHGALDPMVATRYGLIRDLPSSVWFFMIYSAIVGLVIGFWLLLPGLALVLFLLISSLHFGRDWKYKISFGGFGYGAFVLGLPAWTFPEQVEQIFGFLIFENSAPIPTVLLQTLGLIGGFMLLVDRKKLSILRLAELSALALVAFALEPLWYFVIYFCGFHSPRHLIAEFRTMKKETRFIAYIVMLLLTILTLGVAAVSGSHIEKYYESIDMVLYQVIFIGLAALTVPHMCLLEWAARQRRE